MGKCSVRRGLAGSLSLATLAGISPAFGTGGHCLLEGRTSVSDVTLAILLFACGIFLIILLGRAWRLSFVTPGLLFPSFTFFGVLLYLPNSPYYIRSDGELYLAWGQSLAEFWAVGSPPLIEPLWPGKGFWPLIIGAMSYLAGPVVVSPIVLNALILTIMAMVIDRTVALLGAKAPGWVLPLALLTSAPILLFGPSLLREAIFWLGVSVGVLAIAHAGRSRYWPAAIYTLSSASLLLAVRPDAGVVIAYGFVTVTIWLFGFSCTQKMLSKRVASLLLFALVGLSFPAVFDFMRPDTSASDIDTAADALSNPKVVSAFGNSGPVNSDSPGNSGPVNSDSPGNSWWEVFCAESLGGAILCSAAENLPHALLGPFPWEYGPELIWLIAGASGVHFLIVLGLAGWYLLRAQGRRLPALGIFLVALLSMIMFSSILTNYGILIRFRAATEIMLLPLAVSGFQGIVSQFGAQNRGGLKMPRSSFDGGGAVASES